MTYEHNFNQDEQYDSIDQLREQLIAVQASNIALAALIACLPETANISKEEVCNTCSVMSEMDAHTEMVTHEFATSILDVAKEIRKMEKD
jgi:hypothetical protein